jgi:hypothetical protein
MLVISIFPIAYILLFSQQKVMFVRNILVVAPFFSILIARGICYIHQNLKVSWQKISWGMLVASIFFLNVVWLFTAAQSIHNRNSNQFVAALNTYILKHTERTFWVSERVQSDLSQRNGDLSQNIRLNYSPDVDFIAIYSYEAGPEPGLWEANSPSTAPETFGPFEVNLNYYARWHGDDRILLMSPEKANELGIALPAD